MNPRFLAPCLVLLAPSWLLAQAQGPFNGVSLEGWAMKAPMERNKWLVGYATLDPNDASKLKVLDKGDGPPQLINKEKGGVDLYSLERYADCTISLEFMVPQGSNSGVYVLGEYEVQVLDSWGKENVGPGDVGGLYGTAAPKKNAAKRPGEWQSLQVVFEAPKFEGDKKITNAKFVKVTLNGEVIHENVEVKGPTTSSLSGKEAPAGPLMLQGDHGPVAFRNLKITPKK